jgi:cell volume regulation protein A
VEARDVIQTIALVLTAGLLSELLAGLLRIPRMVVLLAAGALLGPEVMGVVEVPLDDTAVEVLLTLGVSFILFHGGLELSFAVLKQVMVGLGALVTVGVVVTAAIVGAVAAAAFGIPLELGFLIGAALAPTDPAILIPLFDQLRLRPKVSQTIVAESGLNDPIGAVLALGLITFILEDGGGVGEPVVDFLVELVASAALGLAFGALLALTISSRRAGIWAESAWLAVPAIIAADYFLEDVTGGSGYLGVFIAGLVVGNMDRLGLGMHSPHEREMRVVVARVSDVMVILIFVLVGANLPWAAIGENLAPALAVVFSLLVLARPIAIALCLVPDRRARWTRAELTFLTWTRETGVVPAAIAGVAVTSGVPDAELVVVCVALAVVTTLLLQTTTKPWLARRLGLVDDLGETQV